MQEKRFGALEIQTVSGGAWYAPGPPQNAKIPFSHPTLKPAPRLLIEPDRNPKS